jgi:hypothetical protein
LTHALTWVAGGILAVWFLATVAANIPPLRRRWFRRRLEFIPNWALFARPRVEDFVLVRRDLLHDGTLTGWREVRIAGGRHWWNALWSPELGSRRAFLALAASVTTRTGRRASRVWPHPGQGTSTAVEDMTTVSHLTILRYLSERSARSVEATQYLIVALSDQSITGPIAASGQSRVVFASEMHLVRPASAEPVDERPSAGVAV